MVLCLVGIGLGQFQNSARRDHRADPISNAVQSSVYPAANSVGTALAWMGDFSNGMRNAARLKQENEELRRTVAAMQMYQGERDHAISEVDQMRRLLGLEAFPGRTQIRGQIIDYAPYENRITVSVGSAEGVKALLPVLSPEGLIGRVDVVETHRCQIKLITAPSQQIGAKVQRSSPVAGLLRGNNPGLLTLEVVDKSVVEVGDPVVTSGYSELIPPGIPIGEVAEVPLPDDYNNRRIKVFPKFRLALNQEVSILK